MKHITVHILIVLTAYAGLFTFFERVLPKLAAFQCRWPHVHSDQTNVLLVADPQLIDNHTYPGRAPWLLSLSKFTADTYIARNYRALVPRVTPDYIFFLGDYLDNGRLVDDGYYEGEMARFNSIFNRWPTQYRQGINWFTNVAGNHDIGSGDGVKLHLAQRFDQSFGQRNSLINISNVDFIQLDTPSYAAEDRTISGEARDFVDGLSGANGNPRVLLTHVPFYRDPETSCGPLREQRKFDQNWGYQYQLALSPEVLTEILSKVRPVVVFTGDNHDYCDIVHPSTGSREITVKLISMAMGILRPGVQLLSVHNGDGGFAYETTLCLLPPPYTSIIVYVVFSVIVGIHLLIDHVRSAPSRYSYSLLPSYDDLVGGELGAKSMSRKVSNFLKEQENDTRIVPALPLPTYTSTSTMAMSRFHYLVMKSHVAFVLVKRFLRRWNLINFVRRSAVLFVLVVAIYYVVAV